MSKSRAAGALLFVLAGCSAPSGQVVARVGGTRIERASLDARVRVRLDAVRQACSTRLSDQCVDDDFFTADKTALERLSIELLIDERLEELEARRLGVNVTDVEVRSSLRELGIDDATLDVANYTYWRASLLDEKLVSKLVSPAVPVTEAEHAFAYSNIRAHWQDNVYCRVVNLPAPELGASAELGAYMRALVLRRATLVQSRRGHLCDFAPAVRSYAGQCSFANPDELPSDVRVHVENMRPGELSMPIRLRHSYVVIERLGTTLPAREAIYDIVSARAAEPLRREARRKWLDALRQRYNVEYAEPSTVGRTTTH